MGGGHPHEGPSHLLCTPVRMCVCVCVCVIPSAPPSDQRHTHLDSDRVGDVGLNEGLKLALGSLTPLQRGYMLMPARGREVVEHGMVAEGGR